MKKCPKCGSTRYHENKGLRKCDKCGFTNDKNYLSKIQEDKNGDTKNFT